MIGRKSTVVLAGKRLSSAATTHVMAAAQRAEATCATWTGKGPLPAIEDAPGVLVAGLAAGERRIPREALDMMAAFPGLPLLLLSTDPLVRHSVSIQEGRVHLMSPPHVEAKIFARMRALLADQRPVAHRRADTAPMGFQAVGSRVIVHESERSRWWVGTLGCLGKRQSPGIASIPYLFEQAAAGLTVLVPFRPEVSSDVKVEGGDVERVMKRMRLAESDEAKVDGLREVVPAGHGVMHLSPSAGEWLFYWPSSTHPLALMSPLRLPPRFLFEQQLREGSPLLRIAAASGDVAVGMSREVLAQDGRDVLEGGAAGAAMETGGAALLRAMDATLRESPEAMSAAIVEVL